MTEKWTFTLYKTDRRYVVNGGVFKRLGSENSGVLSLKLNTASFSGFYLVYFGVRLDRELLVDLKSCLLYTSPSPRD